MWVHVCSGLMSRCVTLIHAYSLVKSGRGGRQKLTIIWPVDNDCGIRYHEVFAENMFSDIETRVIEVRLKHYNNPGVVYNIKNGHVGNAILSIPQTRVK